MKKLFTAAVVCAALLAMASCDKDTTIPENPDDKDHKAIDLSAIEMANCYIVKEPGLYRFMADNQFNLGEGLPTPPEISPTEAILVWQTVPGSISSVGLEIYNNKPYVEFEVSEANGNAIIAVVNEEGTIQWSWHIWMPLQEVTSVMSSSGYDVMNMNLGALINDPGNPDAYGMLYQWGRKDPFPASATLTGTTATVSAPMYDINGNEVTVGNSSWASTTDNTIGFAIAHPTVCLSNYAQYSKTRDWLTPSESDDMLWGASTGRKTCYDPSPAGWRVAPRDAFTHFTFSGGYAWSFADFNIADSNNDGILDLGDYNYGWHFMINADTPMYFPAAARFDGSYAMLMGSMSGLWGSYWSCQPSETMTGGAYCNLSFQIKDQGGNDAISVSPSGSASRADAYSVRCIRYNR